MTMNIIKDFALQLALIAMIVFAYQLLSAGRFNRDRDKNIILSVLFGGSILLCMSFPAWFASDYRVDIRIIPLLLGALYGSWGIGVFLAALIVVYRVFIGVDLGLYTSVLTLLLTMPVILFCQRFFARAKKSGRIQIALLLLLFYCFVGITTEYLVRGISFLAAFQVHFIHIIINIVAVLFFTALNETIKEIISKNQQLQLEAKDAEIAFLRSQIKPHFLYNALNSIAALCHDEPRRAEALTIDLSKYLKSGFDFEQLATLTTLEYELELVQAYVNIEKARFGSKLSVEYDIRANLEAPIPPLILQPLVENAIRHGLMTDWQGGTVKICVRQKTDSTISFAVEDNGCGMSEVKQQEIFDPDIKKKGIGLRNTSQRLQLLYGKGLKVESTEGQGTKIFFDIPVGSIKQSEEVEAWCEPLSSMMKNYP